MVVFKGGKLIETMEVKGVKEKENYVMTENKSFVNTTFFEIINSNIIADDKTALEKPVGKRYEEKKLFLVCLILFNFLLVGVL